MADDDSGTPVSRRTVLGLLGAATGAGTVAGELAPDDGQGSLTGGTMSLNQAYNVAEGLWIGPDSARSNVDAKSGRVYIGASGDGYTLYNGDSGSWDSKGLGDSSNPIPSVTTEKLSNTEVFASEFSGSDLTAKVQNAVDSLPNGRGAVKVGPKPDGSAWAWSDWTIDPTGYNGIELDISDNALIEYGGNGWAITVDYVDGITSGEEKFSLDGGIWRATSLPSGWLRSRDMIHGSIYPSVVIDWTNSNSDATAVRVENDDAWSEFTDLGGIYENVDIGIDFAPASVTGGSGTPSFSHTHLDHTFIGANNIGVRFRGGFDSMNAERPHVFTRADNAVAFEIDNAGFPGGLMLTPQAEDVGSHTGTTFVKTRNFAQRPPLFLGYVADNIDTLVDKGDTNDYLPFIRSDTGGPFKIGELGRGYIAHNSASGEFVVSDINGTHQFTLSDEARVFDFGDFRTGSAIPFRDGVAIDSDASVDLSTVNSTSINEIRVSNGTNLTAGPAWYNSGTWTSLVDGTTYTP